MNGRAERWRDGESERRKEREEKGAEEGVQVRGRRRRQGQSEPGRGGFLSEGLREATPSHGGCLAGGALTHPLSAAP